MSVAPVFDQRNRSRMEIKAKVVLLAENNDLFLAGETRDISMKGLYVKSDVNFPLGSRCNIKIIVPGHSALLTIELTGTVVRREREGYGVTFEKDLEFWPMLAMLKQEGRSRF